MSDWRLTPQNTALVVVDVQEKLIAAMPDREAILTGVRRLISAAAILGVPVLWTTQYAQGLGPVCAEVAGDAPLDKLTFSCAGAPEVLERLRQWHRPRILLCGVEAHVCVQQTAIDLMKDYFVYVAVDAIGSRRELDRQVAIERMRDCGAVITTVEAAVFEMLRQAGTDAFRACLPLFK
jgi:nicotinamidase-related amidase